MCSRGPAPASEPATPGANTWPLAMAAAAVLCSTLVLVRALAPTATPSALFAAPHAATARPIVGGMPVPRVQPVRSHASEPFAAASRWPEVSAAAAAAAATAPEAAHPRPRAGADGVARAGLALLAGAMSVAALLHTARRFLPTRPQCLDPLDLGADYGATRVAMAATTASAPTPKEGVRRLTAADSHETDVVVIGSGLGGLCCAAMLAHNGLRVTVLESHEHLGGCAHDFKYGPYTFESGPSLYSGFTAPGGESFNPLQHVFQVRLAGRRDCGGHLQSGLDGPKPPAMARRHGYSCSWTDRRHLRTVTDCRLYWLCREEGGDAKPPAMARRRPRPEISEEVTAGVVESAQRRCPERSSCVWDSRETIFDHFWLQKLSFGTGFHGDLSVVPVN